jgi:uncharacterized protein YjbI with pentapeptide repeats
MSGRYGRVLAAAGVVAALLAVAGPAGTATATTKLKAPGPPTSVAVAPTDGAFVVSWNPPSSDGGSPVTGYSVTAQVSGTIEGGCSTTGNSCEVSGLASSGPNGKAIKYVFGVTATNSVGTGKAAKVDVLTASTPGTPRSAAVIPADSAFVVSWSPPASDGGSPVTGYSVTAALSGIVDGSCTTTGTSCLVSGLNNSLPTGKPIKYNIAITATNSVGTSKAAKIRAVSTSTAQNCSYVGPDANLQGCDLSGLDLSNADLSGANLSNDDLSGFDLSTTNLSFAFLGDTNVAGADLADANLTGVNSGHTGDVLGVPSALPSGWVLYDGYLIGPKVNLDNVNLSGAPLPSDQDLAGAFLSEANLSGLDLSEADLSGADLFGANLNGTNLADADLSNVESGAVTGTPSALPVNWILPTDVPNVSKGYLVGPAADLEAAVFSGVDLAGADLQGANLMISALDGTDLSGADLQGANLSVSIATDADLSGADLQGANLTVTDLKGANLSGANLSDVVWENTGCPDGTQSTQDDGTCVNNLTP